MSREYTAAKRITLMVAIMAETEQDLMKKV
jgi:hypothetical protein